MNEFIESQKSDENIDRCYEYKGVSICMIDIVGFSKWCTKYSAKDIVRIMIEYNNKLTSLLENYKCLTKIELVGDSCMIVGGMDKNENQDCHVIQMILFCLELLNSNISFKVFQSVNVSVRIGIHIGDVFGTFITHPFKFQLFGNDINTTSRLESSSYPGVIHISNKVYTVLCSNMFINEIDYGHIVPKYLKGVGEVDCAFLTLKKPSILVIEDLKICQAVLSKLLKDYTLEIYSDLELGISKLKENIYTCVLMDTHFISDTIFSKFQEFRRWETKHRFKLQNVIAVTAHPEMKHFEAVLFNNVVSKSELYKLPMIIDSITLRRSTSEFKKPRFWNCFRRSKEKKLISHELNLTRNRCL